MHNIASRLLLRSGLWIAAVVASVAAAPAQIIDRFDFSFFGTGNQPLTNVAFDSAGDMFGTTGVTSGGNGSVWELDVHGAFHLLHYFGGSDGGQPFGSIAVDASGNVYGSCIENGQYGGGNVWEVDNKGNYYDLHDFGSGTDGWSPNGVTMDSSGNLFGTTSIGGTGDPQYGGDGTIWEISATTGYSTLYSFQAEAGDGYEPICSVTFDSNGNMWGTTYAGGYFSTGTVWEIPIGSSYQIVYNFASSSGDGGYPQYGVSIDASGNVFGMSTYAGQYGYGCLWELPIAGGFVDLHDFNSPTDGDNLNSLQANSGPIALPNGVLIGGCYNGGIYGGGTLWGWTSATGFQVIYSFGNDSKGVHPSAPLTLGPDGNLYEACQNGGANGWGSIVEYLAPTALSITTLRGETPGIAGGVGVTFAASVNVPFTFAGGTVTLTSADSSHVQISAAGTSDPPSASDSVTLPAGLGAAQFTISAPVDVANPTPVVLTATQSGFAPVTITVTVQPFVQRLTMSAAGTNSGRTLSGYAYTFEAPQTNQTLNVTTTLADATLVSGPITVPAGQAYSSRITYQMNQVNTTETGTITASLVGGASSAGATASIYGPWLTALSFNPVQVAAGQSSTLTATVNAPPATNQTINVTSPNPSVAPSVQITILAGQTSGTATVPTTNPSSITDYGMNFTASFGTLPSGSPANATGRLNVQPLQISSISFLGTTQAGSTALGLVTLTAPVATTTTIQLTSSNPSLVPSCSVTIGGGATYAYFIVPTIFAWGTTSPTVTLSGALNGGVTRAGALKIQYDSVVDVIVGRPDMSELDSTTVTVLTAFAPPTNQTLTVRSSNTAILPSVTVSIAKNKASGAATLTPTFTALTSTKAITLYPEYSSLTASISVHPEIVSFALNPDAVNGSVGTTATITLYEPVKTAAIAGLASNSSIATVANAVPLNSGGTTIKVPVQTVKRTSTAIAYITLQALGYTKTAKLTVNPGP